MACKWANGGFTHVKDLDNAAYTASKWGNGDWHKLQIFLVEFQHLYIQFNQVELRGKKWYKTFVYLGVEYTETQLLHPMDCTYTAPAANKSLPNLNSTQSVFHGSYNETSGFV